MECVFLQPNTKLLCTHTKGKMAEITRKLNSYEGNLNNRGEEATMGHGTHHGQPVAVPVALYFALLLRHLPFLTCGICYSVSVLGHFGLLSYFL